jgi:GH18 family chitinase
MRVALEAEQLPANKKKLLFTMATPANINVAAVLDLESTVTSDSRGRVPDLDWVNLMAYDYHGSWDKFTGENAPLPGVTATVVNYTQDFKVPGCRLNLGLGFYGHSWDINITQEWASEVIPVGYPAVSGAATLSYGNIAQLLQEANVSTYWNRTVQAPTLWTKPGPTGLSTWVGYDDPLSIAAKLRLVRKYNLSGAMIWSLDQDNVAGGSPLLVSVAGELG